MRRLQAYKYEVMPTGEQQHCMMPQESLIFRSGRISTSSNSRSTRKEVSLMKDQICIDPDEHDDDSDD
ncbi:MAG: hypothetical protein KGS09_20235 [Nitrospirae bacterium]|nr:hypothetical protein [Nitrospirota bacterium]MDE3041631.1 hypothetical protein [Nitrospirota bacterium]